MPGADLHGEASFEWVDDGAFLMMRTAMDDPRIPAGIAIFGSDDATGRYYMLYFDVRGVSRKYDVLVQDQQLSWSTETPEFSQRFTISVSDEGRRLVGEGQMSKDGGAWEPDLRLDYTRAP